MILLTNIVCEIGINKQESLNRNLFSHAYKSISFKLTCTILTTTKVRFDLTLNNLFGHLKHSLPIKVTEILLKIKHN